MKKTITTLFLTLLLSTQILHADQKQFLINMAHANPVPNYMSIIKMNADALGLSSEQKGKVMAWKEKNGPKMATMVDNVIAAEKELKSASMTGVSLDKIEVMTDKLMEMRKQIIMGKTTCRDYMMTVLSKEQWSQLIGIMKAG